MLTFYWVVMMVTIVGGALALYTTKEERQTGWNEFIDDMKSFRRA